MRSVLVKLRFLSKMGETKHRVYAMKFSKVYPLYVEKVEKKGRKKSEVDEVIRWLTGYSQKELERTLKDEVDFEQFFSQAPNMNPLRSSITGVVCGVRVENVEEPLMKEIRILDLLVDKLAKGRALEKILPRN